MVVQLASSGALPRAPKRPRRTGQQVYRYNSRSVNVLLRESLGLYRVKSGVRKCRPLSQLLLEPQETRGSMGLLTSLSQTFFLMLPWAQGPTPRARRPKTCGQRLPVQPGLRTRRSPALMPSVLVVTVPITCSIIHLPFQLIYQRPNFSARKHFSLAFI